MIHDSKILILALGLGLGLTACDQTAEGGSKSDFRTHGVGTGSGQTLNTHQWVSSSARDVYEFDLGGDWHTNSFGYDSKYTRISLANTPYGPITTQVGPPPPPGTPKLVVVPGDDFAVNAVGPNPGDPIYRLEGTDLIGLELRFIVRGFDDADHPVAIEFTDHHEDAEAGDFYEIMKVDPISGATIAPLCEADSGGYRIARIYDGLSVNGESGAMEYVGQGIHHVGCSASAPAKAALFGYNPTEVSVESFVLANRIVRADYCADGHPYTYPGNLLGIQDDFSPGQVGKSLADVYASLGPDEVVEAMWDRHGVLCMDTPRADNVDREDVVCPIRQFAEGTVAYNWQPPSCQGFVDSNPNGEVRFFSTGAL